MSFVQSCSDVIGFLLLSVYAIAKGLVSWCIPAEFKMKSIAGEIALVTGGGGGLGKLLSLRLSSLGATVVVWDINREGVEETKKLVESAGGKCHGYVVDLCNRDDVYQKAAQLNRDVGKVSILINNAGVVSKMKFLDTPDKLIIRTMDVNVMSHFWTVKAFLPGMIEANRGHIVSIASLAGHVGIPKLIDYCASKFAAVGFDEALRMELEADGYNIQTTVICPYFLQNTNMFNNISSRFLPILSPNDVADRIMVAIRCNEKFAIVPGYLQILLAAKWIFPWDCAAMFLRGLVQDVSPTVNGSTEPAKEPKVETIPSKEHNGDAIHQQLPRRISSSERKP